MATLPYESGPVSPGERPWRLVVSITASAIACAVGLLLWGWTVPGLWDLATFTPNGPIRPMGLVSALVVSFFGGMIGGSGVGLVAAVISKRPAAQRVAVLSIGAGLLPFLNFVLFFVIILVRRIPLGD